MTGFRPILPSVALVLAAAHSGVSAKTITGSMDARVRVDTSCQLTAEPLSFGAANTRTTQLDATTSIHLRCGPGVAYSVALDNGQNFNATQRRMANGMNGRFAYVPYQIYRNAARTQVWGATASTVVTGSTPANGDVTLTAYGRARPANALARAYSDLVTVTVNF